MNEILTLTADSPFEFRAVRHSHGWHRLAPYHDDDLGPLLYWLRLADGNVVRLALSEIPDGVQATVETSLALSPIQRSEVIQAVRWMVGLDLDLRPFYVLAADEPRLRGAVERRAGRLLRSATVFEDAVKTILTTNTTWAQTKAMNRRLVEALGEPGPDGGRAFPTPEALAAADGATWTELRLGYRAPYLRELAERVASGALDLEALKTAEMETAELVKELKRIKGIGDYAAATLAAILGRYDRIGVDSLARNLISRHMYAGQPVSPAQIQAAFERFGAYRFLAYWFWDWEHYG